jgi:ABC-type transporter Mla subunit MlaD
MQSIRAFLKRLSAHKSKFLAVIYLVLVFFAAGRVYESVFKFYVSAKFDELGPISKSMPVYYKGFKVGKTGKVMPSTDFKTTHVKLVFKSNMSLLPENVYAKVRKFNDEEKTGHYIEIDYPNVPAKSMLKKGDVIEGKTEPDMASFMSSQLESGALGAMSDHANDALTSLGKTSDAARDLIKDINKLVDEMRPNILATTKNLAQTTGNAAQITGELGDLSLKLNHSLKQKGVDEASANIGKTIANIEQTTAKLNASMDNLDASLGNVKNITGGLNETLSKRFGTARVIFGTPVGQPISPTASPLTPVTPFTPKPIQAPTGCACP